MINEKKEKPRYCHDCRAVSKGVSLNSLFYNAPDFNNPLLAILLSFMTQPVVVLCDIKGFYHMISLVPEDKDCFRFYRALPDGQLEAQRMTRITFGAGPSSSAATWCFRTNAQLHADNFSPEVIETVKNDFYVDDGAFNAPDEAKAIEVSRGLIDICKKGGFTLTKFMSNSPKVLAALPAEVLHPKITSLDDPLPTVSVLGLDYDPKEDMFRVKVPTRKAGEDVDTRSKVLSAVMKIFDPTGMVCPFVILGKKLVQRLCYSKIGWDEPLPPDIKAEFEAWLQEVQNLAHIGVKRWLGLASIEEPVVLHVFADASNTGYGAVVYAIPKGSSEVRFLMAKARVSPEKETEVDVNGSMPRLELQGLMVGVQMIIYIKEHVKMNIICVFYHTDSTVVYYQVQNCEKKYKVYVANRINKYRLVASPDDMRHVPTDLNPADILSRGAMPSETEAWEKFHQGPAYLRLPEAEWPPLPPRPTDIALGVVELKTSDSEEVKAPLQVLVERKSKLASIVRIVAYVLRFIANLKAKAKVSGDVPLPDVQEIRCAELTLIREVQARHFQSEILLLTGKEEALSNKRHLSKAGSQLRHLDPFLDEDGILRVGGRLSLIDEDWSVKHPIILPPCDLTNRLIWQAHTDNAHFGLEFTLSEIRRRYWILQGRETV